MRTRKSSSFLIMGNIHLGYDSDILGGLSTIAEEYKANVIHTGNICTYNEKAMYERRVHKLRTFESIESERNSMTIASTSSEIEKIDSDLSSRGDAGKDFKKVQTKVKNIEKRISGYASKKKNAKDPYSPSVKVKVDKLKSELKVLKSELSVSKSSYDDQVKLLAKRDNLFNKIDTLQELDADKRKQMKDEIAIIEKAESSRIDNLKKYFPNIQFVANFEQCIGSHPEVTLGKKIALSKYIDVQSVNANGDKVSSNPITNRAFNYLKKQKKSVIMPHPVPALRSYERQGLNEAWNMYTTGCLFNADDPNRPSEFYKANYMPSALLVIVDDETGEFHCRRLHFDWTTCEFTRKKKATIIEDGMAHTSAGTIELEGSSTAVYATDTHAPYEHRGVLGSTMALAELAEAETFIHGGDLNDWESVCPHNKGKRLSQENLRFIDDKAAFGRLTNAYRSMPSVKRWVLIDSNHEYWCDRHVDEHAELKGIVDQEAIFSELIPDWEYHIAVNGEDYTFSFGDLSIRHGHKESLAKASQVFHKYLGGHFHSHNEFLRHGSSGAGAMLGPKYLAGNISKWQNCIVSITTYKGKTSFDIKSVLHDKARNVSRFCWRGDIYEVPYYQYDGE